MTNEIELSIVMPCLNEAKTVAACIENARDFLNKYKVNGEIIIADNGSSDESCEIALLHGAKVINAKVPGYGATLLTGLHAANGKYIAIGDSDSSYNFGELMPFLEKLRENYDLVMGSRFDGEIKEGAMPWKNKIIGNPILTLIGRILFSSSVNDFHCGLRAISKSAFLAMDLRTTGMEFASEMVIKASLLKMRVANIPVTLSQDGRDRPPHLRPWRDGWRHLRFMLLYSPRWLFLYPGFSMIIIGSLVGGRLLFGPIHLGKVNLDVHSLLYCAVAILIGFQAIAFSLLSKIFAVSEGLLPKDERISRFEKWATLELGLLSGAFLSIFGIIGTVIAFLGWGKQDFGNLDPTITFRLVIPSALAFALGIQFIFTSFFMSVLKMKFNRGEKLKAD